MPNIKEETKKLLSNPTFHADPWSFLTDELDQWAKEGVIAEFWWRDDDAVSDTPALKQLIETADQSPLSLAVIPDTLEESLPLLTAQHQNISILQHGFAHLNHAPANEKKAEFRDHRPQEMMIDELKTGFDVLSKEFGPQFKPLFVPPWNRLGKDGEAAVKEAGLSYISTFTPRKPHTGPYIINTHIDPVNWKAGRVFLGEPESLAQAILHLRAKREIWSNVDVIEPTGFLTHHLIHDDKTWAFTDKFNQVIQEHEAASWLDIDTYISSFSFDF